jgi:gluconate 2-dehydrogenase gamma chain
MMTRRDVLYAGAALFLLPCEGAASYAFPVTVLEAPFQTIALVHRDLFPGSARIPSPHLLKALDYLGGVLKDPYVDDDEKAFLKNGAGWLNEQAREDFGKAYYHLDEGQRQTVLRTVSEKTWGENWLWSVFAYLFEALLCDPVYGANTHEAGWHWLGFVPGYPRPEKPFI